MKKINLAHLQQYLLAKNWQKQISKKGNKVFFRKFDGDKVVEIALPLTKDFSDYDESVEKAINILAKYEQCSLAQIANSLSTDVVDNSKD